MDADSFSTLTALFSTRVTSHCLYGSLAFMLTMARSWRFTDFGLSISASSPSVHVISGNA